MYLRAFSAIFCLFLMTSCSLPPKGSQDNKAKQKAIEDYAGTTEIATIAGGCFWCVEADLEKLDGVIAAISGYGGGGVGSPTYQNHAGHREVAQITFDPAIVPYRTLIDYFLRHIDPTDADGQFVDRGFQYSPAIYYHSDAQKKDAEEALAALESSGTLEKPIATEVLPFTTFYPAEDYHQDYYKKSPIRYYAYRYNSGRDQFLKKTFSDEPNDVPVEESPAKYSKPSEEEIRSMLTPLQYDITQEEGTEPPFTNEYNDNHREGIYVDVVSGEPLFSSVDKFDSVSGWPSFTQPLDTENVVHKKDYKLIFPRTEIRSKYGDSHLGHLFKDGPEPTGLRYCINSAALRFVPKENLVDEGYEEYMPLF